MKKIKLTYKGVNGTDFVNFFKSRMTPLGLENIKISMNDAENEVVILYENSNALSTQAFLDFIAIDIYDAFWSEDENLFSISAEL